MQNHPLARAATAAAALLFWITPAAAVTFDQLVVFGDSYSDVGNISAATGGVYPGAPYFEGRYSNGPIWIDDVAAALGLPILPSLDPSGKGTDYAFGGAALLVDQQGIPSLTTQVGTYLTAVSGEADPAALYVIWGGINDLLLDWDDTPSALPSLPNAYAAGVLKLITGLKAAGARYFLIGQMQEAGKTPAWNWGVAEAKSSSAYANTMNGRLANAINTAKASGQLSGVTIWYLPAYTMMNQIIVPGSTSQAAGGAPLFGLPDVVDPCIDGTTPCQNPNQYFFWDGVHPTATGHSLFAERALALIAP